MTDKVSNERLAEMGVDAITRLARMKGPLADVSAISAWMHDARNALRNAQSEAGAVDGEYAWGLLRNTAEAICKKLESESASVTVFDQAALRESLNRVSALTRPAPPLAEPSPTVVAALRMMTCPRPCNHRPDDFDVGQCFDAGECGCVAGNALAHSAPLAATDAMVERAAKGLYEADDVWNVAFHWPDLAEGQTTADTYRRLARAALTAALEAKQ